MSVDSPGLRSRQNPLGMNSRAARSGAPMWRGVASSKSCRARNCWSRGT